MPLLWWSSGAVDRAIPIEFCHSAKSKSFWYTVDGKGGYKTFCQWKPLSLTCLLYRSRNIINATLWIYYLYWSYTSELFWKTMERTSETMPIKKLSYFFSLLQCGAGITGFFSPQNQGQYFKLVLVLLGPICFLFYLFTPFTNPNYFQVEFDGGKNRFYSS